MSRSPQVKAEHKAKKEMRKRDAKKKDAPTTPMPTASSESETAVKPQATNTN